jgi:hypothetical protein
MEFRTSGGNTKKPPANLPEALLREYLLLVARAAVATAATTAAIFAGLGFVDV